MHELEREGDIACVPYPFPSFVVFKSRKGKATIRDSARHIREERVDVVMRGEGKKRRGFTYHPHLSISNSGNETLPPPIRLSHSHTLFHPSFSLPPASANLHIEGEQDCLRWARLARPLKA
jgi:hypothetical protein